MITSLFNHFIAGYTNLLNLHGRASRKAYWHFLGMSLVFLGTLTFILQATHIHFMRPISVVDPIERARSKILFEIFLVLTQLATFSYTTRRLHDTGKNNWLLCLCSVSSLLQHNGLVDSLVLTWALTFPFAYLLYTCCKKGMSTPNRYGPVPT